MSRIYLALLLLLLAGCSYSPIVTEHNTIYLGAFKKEVKEEVSCRYSRVKGVGLRTGLFHIGMGLFDYRRLEVTTNKAVVCDGILATVYVIEDK